MFGDVKTDLKGVLQGDTLKGQWVNYRGGGTKEVTGRRLKNGTHTPLDGVPLAMRYDPQYMPTGIHIRTR